MLEIKTILQLDTKFLNMDNIVKNILNKYNDKNRMMDIFHDIQKEFGHIDDNAIKEIGHYFNISSVDVIQTLSFYHFFRRNKSAKYNIYLNNGIVSELYNRNKIAKAFENATRIKFNSISKDGLFGLYDTSDIGMCDQEPAAIINGVVFPKITTFRVREIIKEFRKGKSATDLINSFGDGHNQDELISSMVVNNLNRRGRVIFSGYESGSGLKKALEMTPDEVIELVKNSNIRGRGGAGFPIGLKWKYCRASNGDKKYIVCNADEGEPGTFKDRVLLTELPMDIFEGMCIAAYAVGASEGIIYLRKEYEYLLPYLNENLEKAGKNKLLGKNILGHKGFDFDIRIQLGAGAYVCGEESALLESCEGKRGEPRNRPPFPIEKGYLDNPTVINNVESLNAIPKILNKGADWYRSMGTKESSGTKLISISGDVMFPGVFEVEWGITVREMIEMAGALNTKAVVVGGPSGKILSENQFSHKIAYEDMSTGGAIIVFNKSRNILNIVKNFTDFFIEESCGSCAPCRYLTVILRKKLQKILDGHGTETDIIEMEHWAKQMKKANRCGLGQSAANPILSSLENFRNEYLEIIQKGIEYETEFDIEKAIINGAKAVGRFPSA